MKKLTNTLRACGIATVLAATTAVGQLLNINVTVDENGLGVITGGAPAGLPDPFPLGFGVGLEPISGISTLFYTLPTTVSSGDVFLYEANPIPGQSEISDLIRFSGNKMFFFSDSSPGDLDIDLADVAAIPQANPLLPVLVIPEIGPEGLNGAIYHPNGPADPGFAAAVGPSVTYNFISDVPEPASLSLLGLAGAAVLRRKRR